MPVPRLAAAKVRRLDRLLDMLYKPGEIAAELDISVLTFVRSYVPAGAPVVIDSKGKMWINGQAFATWARAYLASKNNQPRGKMKPGEAFCFRCRKVVEMQRVKRKPVTNLRVMVSGICPVCGGKLSRFDREMK